MGFKIFCSGKKKMVFVGLFCVRAKAELFCGWRFSASDKKREPETDPEGHAQKKVYNMPLYLRINHSAANVRAIKIRSDVKSMSSVFLTIAFCTAL